jgi:hypothetical protein
MEYKGKVYAKIGCKFIECSQTVEDLENEIKSLKEKLSNIDLQVVKEFKRWQEKHPDEDYQMDEIHDFISSVGRGNLHSLFAGLIHCL